MVIVKLNLRVGGQIFMRRVLSWSAELRGISCSQTSCGSAAKKQQHSPTNPASYARLTKNLPSEVVECYVQGCRE